MIVGPRLKGLISKIAYMLPMSSAKLYIKRSSPPLVKLPKEQQCCEGNDVENKALNRTRTSLVQSHFLTTIRGP